MYLGYNLVSICCINKVFIEIIDAQLYSWNGGQNQTSPKHFTTEKYTNINLSKFKLESVSGKSQQLYGSWQRHVCEWEQWQPTVIWCDHW